MPAIPPGYRIKISRLAIDLPLAEGEIERDAVRRQTPENFAFHLPGSALPEDNGNAYLYAHARRNVPRAVERARGPTDVSWAAPNTRARLTLQTSTGPNPGAPRFVVIALPA